MPLVEICAGLKRKKKRVQAEMKWSGSSIMAVKKARMAASQKRLPSQSYSIGIDSIAKKSQPYSRGRVWAAPTEMAVRSNACLLYKKIEKMYRFLPIGCTIDRRNNSTTPETKK